MLITRKLEMYRNYSTVNGMMKSVVDVGKFAIAKHWWRIVVVNDFHICGEPLNGRGCSFPALIF